MMTLIRVAMWTMIGIVLFTFMSCMQNLKAAPLNEKQIWCWSNGWEYDHKVYINYSKQMVIPCLSPDLAIFYNLDRMKEYHIRYEKHVGQTPAIKL